MFIGRDRRRRRGASRKAVSPAPRRVPLRPLVWLAGAGALLYGLVWAGGELARPGTLPLRTAQLHGEFVQVTPAAIRAVLARFAHQGFVYVDTAEVQRSVEALPWIRTASVYRVWPDTLRVEFTEQRAVARWKGGGLVNRDGELFTPPPASYPPDLPLLHAAPEHAPELVRRYREIARILAPLRLAVATLEMDRRRSWRLELDNGITLLLGREGESYQRLLRFVRTYDRALAGRVDRIEQIDLRYTNGFAVRWREDAGHPGEEAEELNNV